MYQISHPFQTLTKQFTRF